MKLARVLVVHKKSLYQIYVEEHGDAAVSAAIDAGDPVAQQFVVSHQIQQRALETILSRLNRRHLAVTTQWRGELESVDGYDLILTIGGDGTVLDTSHEILSDVLLMGINSHPQRSAGILCAGTANQIDELIDGIESETLKPTQATRLRVRVNDTEVLGPCLNDVLLAHPSPAEVSRFELRLIEPSGERIEIGSVDGQPIRSSGLWVATATGSTGALQSAGGRPLRADALDLQYWVREPYLSSAKKRKPITGRFKDKRTLQIINRTRQAMIWGDGAHHKCSVQYNQAVTIDIHPRPINIIRRSYR